MGLPRFQTGKLINVRDPMGSGEKNATKFTLRKKLSRSDTNFQ